MRYRKIGSTVHLWWMVSQSDASYWECSTHLPEGLRPSGNTYLPAVMTNGDGYSVDHVAIVCVTAAGAVGFQCGSGVAGALNRGCGCYPANAL